jgi:MraZ protein
VAIPRKFREVLSKEDDDRIVITRSFDVRFRSLDIYVMRQWFLLEQKLQGRPQFDRRTIAFKQLYIHPAQDLSVDKQGRILVPTDLRDYAGLSKDVVSTGDLEKFQLWSADEWARMSKEAESVAREEGFLEDFGI